MTQTQKDLVQSRGYLVHLGQLGQFNAHIFIKVVVQLLSEDVPSLGDWGKCFIIDLLTGKASITCISLSCIFE